MAVKTITIDLEAYDLLAREKRGNESFSRVIKRRLGPSRTAAGLLRALPGLPVTEEALDRIEDVVRQRAASPAESAPLIEER